MRIDILTLFPDMCRSVYEESIIGRAKNKGILEIFSHNIRDFSNDKHRRVDDTPYGGGMGMLMQAQPIYDCYKYVCEQTGKKPYVIYLSPQGKVFSQDKAKELAHYENLILLCGHYEGIDERVLSEIVDEEISIGDYVLTGGELPACIVIDAVSRLKEGVLADAECYENESVASGILEYPQYTKPRVFMDREVPEVLLMGDHQKVDRWRLEEAVRITKERRPDLLALHPEIEESLKQKNNKKPRK